MSGFTRNSLCAACLVALVLSVAGPGISSQAGLYWWASANAQESGHSGGGHTGGGHSGGRGSAGGHGGGHHDSGDEEEGGHDAGHSPGPKGYGSHGTHHGGHGHDVARGGGKTVEYRVLRGRRPVWAQEGIPEVELGRLNVSRAPGRVLAHAEGEALATYVEGMSILYSLDAEQAAALLTENFRDVVRYDSPLQNLALYRDVMVFGDTRLKELDPGLAPASQLDLAAIFLGSAADKSIPISEDTVIALNRIMGLVELSAEDRSTLAGKADTVRAAILTGHGPVEIH